jgi:hypothetical protein
MAKWWAGVSRVDAADAFVQRIAPVISDQMGASAEA